MNPYTSNLHLRINSKGSYNVNTPENVVDFGIKYVFFPRSGYNIDQQFNSIKVNGTEIQLPSQQYSEESFLTTLKSILKPMGIEITLTEHKKVLFKSSSEFTIQFEKSNHVSRILGLNDTIYTSEFNTSLNIYFIVGDQRFSVYPNRYIFIRCQELSGDNILAYMVVENTNKDIYFYSQQKLHHAFDPVKIYKLSFTVTNEFGELYNLNGQLIDIVLNFLHKK